jgi:hypothetical protein
MRWAVPQLSFASRRFGSTWVKYAPLATYTVEPRTATPGGLLAWRLVAHVHPLAAVRVPRVPMGA